MHIAIVEDESKLATLLSDYLQKDDYETSIYQDGTEALEACLLYTSDAADE